MIFLLTLPKQNSSNEYNYIAFHVPTKLQQLQVWLMKKNCRTDKNHWSNWAATSPGHNKQHVKTEGLSTLTLLAKVSSVGTSSICWFCPNSGLSQARWCESSCLRQWVRILSQIPCQIEVTDLYEESKKFV